MPGVVSRQNSKVLPSVQHLHITEDHYNGYRAALVCLDNATINDIEDLIIDAWRCIAPNHYFECPALAYY